MKEESNLEDYKLWLKQCPADLSAAQLLFKQNSNYPLVCYLSQLNVERYLKSVLMINSQNIIGDLRTHNCLFLLKEASIYIPDLTRLKKESNLITRYYVASRYPGQLLGDLTREEAENALKIEDQFRAIILPYFKNIEKQ